MSGTAFSTQLLPFNFKTAFPLYGGLPSEITPGLKVDPKPVRLWSYRRLAGRLSELSADGADASLSLAMQAVYDAQCEGETVVWVGDHESSFYPLDAVEQGVDIQHVVVVRATVKNLMQAAYELARSGSFGLLVIDVTQFKQLDVREGDLAKLLALCQKYRAAVLFLTHKHEHDLSLGALISFRGHARRQQGDGFEYTCALEVLKDKKPESFAMGTRQELLFCLRP